MLRTSNSSLRDTGIAIYIWVLGNRKLEHRRGKVQLIDATNQIHKRQQAQARALLVQIPYANTLTDAGKLRKQFIARYQDQFPKAVKALDRDWDRMLTFFDFPTEHWRHLRTTNVVESPFASVRLRTNAAKRYKKVAAASALIWRTLMVAEKRFRRLNAPHLRNRFIGYTGFKS